MYELRKEQPTRASKADPAFVEALGAMQPGDAFDFPVNGGLKAPLMAAKNLAKKFRPEGARYAWKLSGNSGTVYRTK